MKRNQIILAAVVAGSLAPLVAPAQSNDRLTFSARFGLNISGKFSGTAPIAVPATSRTTPDGDPYNYDNGYVLPDVSGSGDGYTWYWGYDDSAAQVDATANTILMSRSAGPATLRSPEMDDNSSLGMELVYARELGRNEHFRFGVEGALNYLSIGLHGGSHALRGPTITDAIPYTPGTTPPDATAGNPYQGTYNGPGFVVGTTPVSSTETMAEIGSVTGSRDLDADLWGARVGPYLEYDLHKNVSVGLSGGLAVGLLDASVSWNESVTFNNGGSLPADVGSGDDQDFLVGLYLAANVQWRLSERWSAAGSLQYQNLGTYSQTFGTRKAELDLSKSLLITLGVSYNF